MAMLTLEIFSPLLGKSSAFLSSALVQTVFRLSRSSMSSMVLVTRSSGSGGSALSSGFRMMISFSCTHQNVCVRACHGAKHALFFLSFFLLFFYFFFL